ncbi:TPA: tyrosine-type recombinase/integrase [Serratia marcescens]
MPPPGNCTPNASVLCFFEDLVRGTADIRPLSHSYCFLGTTDFMISAGIRKNSPDGSIHPDGLTKKFVAARKASGLEFQESPPTFHEIRSLSGRLYEKQNDKAFAQKLLGHTTEMMTLKYLKTRGKEYVML